MMMWTFWVLVLVSAAEMVMCRTYYEHESREKVYIMKDKIDVMYSEQEKMDGKLDKILEILGADEEVAKSWPPLALLNVSRESFNFEDDEMGFELKYTLWYRNVGHDDDVTVEWFGVVEQHSDHSVGPLEGTRSDGVYDGDGTIWSTSTTVNITDDSLYRFIILKITRRDINFWYTAKFEPSNRFMMTNKTVESLQVDTLEILNDDDIVYSKEKPPVIKIRTHYVNRNPHEIDEIGLNIEEIAKDSGKLERRFCRPNTLHIEPNCKILPGEKKFRDYMEYEIVFDEKNAYGSDPPSADVSGFTSAYITTLYDDGPTHVLNLITQEISVVVRPATQQGPYPDDFLEMRFVTMGMDSSTSFNGDVTIIHCRFMLKSCPISCEVYGNDLQEVKLIQNFEDGETEEVEAKVDILRDSHLLIAHAILTTPTNITTVENYTCVAKNKRGQRVEEKANVVYEYKIFLDYDNSYVSYNRTHLKAECVAYGYPISDLQITTVTDNMPLPNVTVDRDPENFKFIATTLVDLREFRGYDYEGYPDYGRFYTNCVAVRPDGTNATIYYIAEYKLD